MRSRDGRGSASSISESVSVAACGLPQWAARRLMARLPRDWRHKGWHWQRRCAQRTCMRLSCYGSFPGPLSWARPPRRRSNAAGSQPPWRSGSELQALAGWSLDPPVTSKRWPAWPVERAVASTATLRAREAHAEPEPPAGLSAFKLECRWRRHHRDWQAQGARALACRALLPVHSSSSCRARLGREVRQTRSIQLRS